MQLYGLIGYPLVHSFSKKYFTEKFSREDLIDCYYENFELENINSIREKFYNKPELKGLNITIPYKKEIINYLDDCNEVVKNITACNCIKIVNGKWMGYNTDVAGFEKSFAGKLQTHHTKALILGTGGSAKAVEYVLQKLNIDYLFVSRSKYGNGIINYNEINKELLKDYLVIINTTPVGQFPDIDKCPKIPYRYISDKHYFFDLIYNPEKTLFLKNAEEKGAVIQNGYDMLIMQAEESWRIWKKD